MTTSDNQVCSFDAGICFDPPLALSSPKGVAIVGDGSLWVANSGNGSVSTFGYLSANGDQTDYFSTSTVQYLHDADNGNTMSAPYGIAIDQSGNVFLSNAGCVGNGCTPRCVYPLGADRRGRPDDRPDC